MSAPSYIPQVPNPKSRLIRFGLFCLDPDTAELTKAGHKIRLPKQSFQVLLYLLERPQEPVTREQLRHLLWPDGTYVDFEDGLNAVIKKLRTALGDSAENPRFIETIPRHGYRFIAPTSGDDSASDDRIAGVTVVTNLPSSSVDVITDTRTSRRFLPLAAAFLIVATIVLGGILVRKSRAPISAQPTNVSATSASRIDPEAATEYARGRELWARRNEPSLKAAITHFKQAIERQPDYGIAYSGLADSYTVMPFYSRMPFSEAYSKARAAAQKAVELAPRSAEAHTSLAYVRFYADWNFAGAEEEFDRALQLDPNYATALQWHAEYLSLIGSPQNAIAEINRALELMPNSAVMHHNAAQILRSARRDDDAIVEYRKALQLDPQFATSYAHMAIAYTHKGRYDVAVKLDVEGASHMQDPTRVVIARELAETYASKGRQAYLRELLNLGTKEDPDRGAYALAMWSAELGDKDGAFQWLERAYRLHSSSLLSLNVDPELDPLRSDPRFLELRRKIGLPAPVLEF